VAHLAALGQLRIAGLPMGNSRLGSSGTASYRRADG